MANLDDLLRPTVAPTPQGKLPWRVSSQFWVAFFGGIPAVTAIAFLNARRLGVTPRNQQRIILAGIVAMAAYFSVLVVFFDLHDRSASRTIRLGGQVIAVLLFLLLARIQREDDGRHRVFGSGEYASLWGPGILACVVSVVIIVVCAAVAVLLLS